MNMRKIRQDGFTLLELMAVMAFITLIAGSIFLVLNMATQRFQMESQVLDSFQTARLAIDQMTRDIHAAGFPPANVGWNFPGTPPTAVAFAWAPGYSAANPCTMGVTCTTPSATDLIIEGNISPSTGAGVQWIHYTLAGTTLMRGVVPKTAGTDPVVATSAAGVMFPYVENVVNNAGTPVFNYECDTTTTPATPVACTATGAPNNTAGYIRQVGVTLVVRSAQADPKTGRFETVSLHSQVQVVNPPQ